MSLHSLELGANSTLNRYSNQVLSMQCVFTLWKNNFPCRALLKNYPTKSCKGKASYSLFFGIHDLKHISKPNNFTAWHVHSLY